MWPKPSLPELKLPPEVGRAADKLSGLLDRIDSGLDGVIRAAWLDGCVTGVLGTAVLMMLIYLLMGRNK
jgi:hypothetical protein